MGELVVISTGRQGVSRKRGRKPQEIVAPTDQQLQTGTFLVDTVYDRTEGGALNLKGTAYRRRPMIDVLADAGLFTEAEHKALRHYRHHADIADRSPISDSLGKRQGCGGGGDGPTITLLNAVRITSDVEAAAGSLRDILRAIVVYDMSLNQWVIKKHGAVERQYLRKGRKGTAVMVNDLRPSEEHLSIARLEIKMAAGRVEAEINA